MNFIQDDQKEYDEKDFQSLKLVKIINIPQLQKDVSEFMRRNSLELDYQNQDIFDFTQNSSQELRMSSFLVFVKSNQKFYMNDEVIKYIKRTFLSSELINQQSKIVNICSPFGLNSKELFLNVNFKGIVANKFSETLYLCDLDGNLINVEGSPIIEKKSNKLLGIRLPNLHMNNLFIQFSTFTPIQIVLQAIYNLESQSKSKHSSGILIDPKRGLVLTNSHCIMNQKSEPTINIGGKSFQSQVISKAQDQETLDFCLLKLDLRSITKKDQDLINLSKPKINLEKVKQIREGDTVYSCGFGLFNNLKYPSIYKGYITRIAYHEGKNLFIQHTAKTYPGQSGGGLFDKDGFLIGLLFKNCILNVNQEKSIKLQLDTMCTAISLEQIYDTLFEQQLNCNPFCILYFKNLQSMISVSSQYLIVHQRESESFKAQRQNQNAANLGYQQRQQQFLRAKNFTESLINFNLAITFVANLLLTLITIFTIIFPLLRVVASDFKANGLVYLIINEAFRVIMSLVLCISFICLSRQRFIMEQLGETFSQSEHHRHVLRSQESEKIAGELIDRIPDADLEDENVLTELAETEQANTTIIKSVFSSGLRSNRIVPFIIDHDFFMGGQPVGQNPEVNHPDHPSIEVHSNIEDDYHYQQQLRLRQEQEQQHRLNQNPQNYLLDGENAPPQVYQQQQQDDYQSENIQPSLNDTKNTQQLQEVLEKGASVVKPFESTAQDWRQVQPSNRLVEDNRNRLERRVTFIRNFQSQSNYPQANIADEEQSSSSNDPNTQNQNQIQISSSHNAKENDLESQVNLPMSEIEDKADQEYAQYIENEQLNMDKKVSSSSSFQISHAHSSTADKLMSKTVKHQREQNSSSNRQQFSDFLNKGIDKIEDEENQDGRYEEYKFNYQSSSQIQSDGQGETQAHNYLKSKNPQNKPNATISNNTRSYSFRNVFPKLYQNSNIQEIQNSNTYFNQVNNHNSNNNHLSINPEEEEESKTTKDYFYQQ
eukprot:403330820